MTRLAVLLFVAATACGGSPKRVTDPGVGGGAGTGGEVADPIPATTGPECAIVADKLATVAHAETPDRQAEARDKLRTRCADDSWSDEARNCFSSVETDAEIEGCTKLLTDAQLAALRASAPDMGPKDPWRSTSTDAPDADGTLKDTPPAGPRSGTRGATQRNSSDPCEGGERK